MKLIRPILFAFLAISARNFYAQGFVNLDFESAQLNGYLQGASNVPTNNAIPGWTAYYSQPGFGTGFVSQIAYDAISLGGAVISINDSNTGGSFTPIQGRYSVYLFGGSYQVSSSISQTGLIPAGTESLLLDGSYGLPSGFVVTLNGQAINMVILQNFSNYTLYGGDISSFGGQVTMLSITEPAPTGIPPSAFLLDNIQFSSSAVPEPSELALAALGALLLGFCRWRNFSR
jgi:hypothetical protein